MKRFPTLIANADRVTGAIGENLRGALQWLPEGRRLLTVKCDVEMETALTGRPPSASS